MAEYRVQVGKIGERPYLVSVSAEPSLNDIKEFAALLFYNDPESEDNVQVAGVDTAHGYTHIDKLYAEHQGKEEMDLDVWEAQNYLGKLGTVCEPPSGKSRELKVRTKSTAGQIL